MSISEPGRRVYDAYTILRIMRKSMHEALFGVLGYGDQPIGGDRSTEHALETTCTVGFRRPRPILEEAQIVKRENQPRMGQASRREEIIRVDDVWLAKFRFERRSGVRPESLRLGVAMVRSHPDVAEVRELIAANLGIVKMVAEGRIENVLVIPIARPQRPYQPFGIEAASRLAETCLAGIKSNSHIRRASPTEEMRLPAGDISGGRK